MNIKNILVIFFILTPVSASAEVRTFIGLEAVMIETNIDYNNGSEDYEFSGGRLKYGAEFSDGGIAGIEILSGDKDDIIDPFGTPFRLETDTAIGIFAHLGRPFYFRMGWSVWDSEYTDLVSGITDKEEVSAIEYGVGFRLPLGSGLEVYTDYSKRNTDAKYPTHITGSGKAEYDSDIISAGISFKF